MSEFEGDIADINIEDELRDSFMEYAMSVIVARALPDVRDGLKPVHRRALFAMSELNNTYNRPTLKSARVLVTSSENIILMVIARLMKPSFAWLRTSTCVIRWLMARVTLVL
jgi:hypothetical protein